MSMFLYKGKDSSFFSAFIDVISSIFMCRWCSIFSSNEFLV